MILYDYHTHSSHSSDGRATMSDMVKAAISLGLKEYAITDHIDFGWPHREIITPYGIAANMAAMRAVRAKFAQDIKVLCGAEISLRCDVAREVLQIAVDCDFDIIIGSTHDVKGVDFGWPQFYGGLSKHAVYMAYFENLLDVVTCFGRDGYDVLGHFDYVARYGDHADKSLRYADYRDIIDAILKALIAAGKGIEINTSGFAYGLSRAHPQIDILRRYAQLGGEIITVGSDAHHTKSIGQYFDRAHEMLKTAGIKYITRFDKRRPTQTRI